MRKPVIIFSITVLLMLFTVDTFSQCAMCRRVAETGHSNDKSLARGLNKGIIYLLSVPYILGGIGVFVWYRNKKKN